MVTRIFKTQCGAGLVALLGAGLVALMGAALVGTSAAAAPVTVPVTAHGYLMQAEASLAGTRSGDAAVTATGTLFFWINGADVDGDGQLTRRADAVSPPGPLGPYAAGNEISSVSWAFRAADGSYATSIAQTAGRASAFSGSFDQITAAIDVTFTASDDTPCARSGTASSGLFTISAACNPAQALDTPFSDVITRTSDWSIGSGAVMATATVSLPATGLLMVSGLGLGLALRRRRSQRPRPCVPASASS